MLYYHNLLKGAITLHTSEQNRLPVIRQYQAYLRRLYSKIAKQNQYTCLPKLGIQEQPNLSQFLLTAKERSLNVIHEFTTKNNISHKGEKVASAVYNHYKQHFNQQQATQSLSHLLIFFTPYDTLKSEEY